MAKVMIEPAVVAAFGLLDCTTGAEVFYRKAVAVASSAALVPYEAEQWAGHAYEHPWVVYWKGQSPRPLFILRVRLDLERGVADWDPRLLNPPFRLRTETAPVLPRRQGQPIAAVYSDRDSIKVVSVVGQA